MSQNPLSDIRVVRINATCPDPALDLQAMDIPEYAKTRKEELIKLNETAGVVTAKPDLFVISRLPAVTLNALKNNGASLSQNAVIAFLTGCLRIELGDGTVMQPTKTIKTKVGTKSIDTADDDWFEECCDRFGHNTVLEMGQVVIDLAGLPRGAHGPFLCWVGMARSS